MAATCNTMRLFTILLLFSASLAEAQSGFSIGAGIEPGLSYNGNSGYFPAATGFIKYQGFADYRFHPKWSLETA